MRIAARGVSSPQGQTDDPLRIRSRRVFEVGFALLAGAWLGWGAPARAAIDAPPGSLPRDGVKRDAERNVEERREQGLPAKPPRAPVRATPRSRGGAPTGPAEAPRDAPAAPGETPPLPGGDVVPPPSREVPSAWPVS